MMEIWTIYKNGKVKDRVIKTQLKKIFFLKNIFYRFKVWIIELRFRMVQELEKQGLYDKNYITLHYNNKSI